MTASFSLEDMTIEQISKYFGISVEAAQAKLDEGAKTADDIWYGVNRRVFTSYKPENDKPKIKPKKTNSPFGKRYF